MKLDLKPFDDRVEKRFLTRREKGDLLIYNYTNSCHWENAWDKYTEMARGLILKKDGTVVARPFPKFYNIGQQEKTDMKNLPVYQPEVTEKLDGSLGILYHDGIDYAISTRGAFDSDQAKWATNWLKNKKVQGDYLENVTYLFEIIYPMNRIVVDYKDREELVLLGLVDNETGKIYPYLEVSQEAERLGFSYPRHAMWSIEQIQEMAKNEKKGMSEEGFVLFYPKENLQVKVKYEDYVRLHRLTFGISVKSIWENMAYGQKPKVIFADAPDEVMKWVDNWAKMFDNKYLHHLHIAQDHLDKVNLLPTRKEQALYLQKEAREYLSIVFSMLDEKDYRKAIFNKFRPTAEDAVKSFRMIGEEDV